MSLVPTSEDIAYGWGYKEASKAYQGQIEALAARVAVLEAALGRATRILSYPVDTSIQERGYSLRTDDDSVGHAVEVLIAALSPQPTHATQVEQIADLGGKHD